MRIVAILMLLVCALSGCASARGRFMAGAAIGGVAVGGGATLLSPNFESRGLNALVFGLLGALGGGLVGLLTYDDGKVPSSSVSLESKERAAQEGLGGYPVPVARELPDFVKQRLQPAIIEELEEPDSVSEDGTLHEPHKIYRIQRPAELYARPAATPQQKDGHP